MEQKESLYSVLGVDQTATTEDIKSAYRSKAKILHPDVNRSSDAKSKFQAVLAAYEILSDEKKRAGYDAYLKFSESSERSIHLQDSEQALSTIKCSKCGSISAQPRYIILWTVMSFAFITIRKPTQGIYCQKCASRAALKCSLLTWVLGWWGIPWGPIWSIRYLSSNIVLGQKPRSVNAALLLHQALAFTQQNLFTLAYAAAEQSLKFADDEKARHFASIVQQRASAMDPSVRTACLRSAWSSPSAVLAQLAPLMLVGGLAAYTFHDDAVYMYGKNFPNETNFLGNSAFPFKGSSEAIPVTKQDQQLDALSREWYVTAENLNLRAGPSSQSDVIGCPVPRFASLTHSGVKDTAWMRVKLADGREGYVYKKYTASGSGKESRLRHCRAADDDVPSNGEILSQSHVGQHVIVVRNGLGEDAVVKLREDCDTILSFFVSARSSAVIETVPAGSYQVSFSTGKSFSRQCAGFSSVSSAQTFEEKETFAERVDGNYVYRSRLELTLHTVVGGNTHAPRMPADLF